MSIVLVLTCHSLFSLAQDCPPNIDFENGTFDGWTCYTGTVVNNGVDNQILLNPSGGAISGRHTMNSAFDGGIDYYGGFPVNCPNGSGYSVRLGNNLGGTEAEGISYEFTIPAGQNTYSLIYHYAVVFQDPNHLEIEQPRMEIEVMNLTDNTLIDCSSFTFIPFGTILPGFYESPNTSDGTPVWCKNWTAVSINLDGQAGKTVRLTFKTADCTFRRHFGYAYIDVNTECTGEFLGATYCPDDTAVNVVAPHGYQGYTWYNSDFSQTLGFQQVITFSPLPVAGTTIAVQVIPYYGYGCIDTFYAKLIDTLTVIPHAGEDALSCNRKPVMLGVIPKPGLVYSWSPPTGLNNPSVANPLASPESTTMYVVTTNNSGGGCVTRDSVIVTASNIDNTLGLDGRDQYCFEYGDSSVLFVLPADSIQWFRNDIPIPGATKIRYKATESGTYHALLFNEVGCIIPTLNQDILIDRQTAGINYPLQYAVINIPLSLEARSFGTSVQWSPASQLNNDASYTPVFNGAFDQLYTITITTQAGCITVDTQLVKTVKSIEMHVPTAFTPNNDGLNDFLRPILMGIKELRYFRIYNRWGQLLFETKNPQPGWNGKFKSAVNTSEVVVWVAEGLGLDGKIYIRKGTTIVVR